ncbi:MAG: multidrug MFS transporter, partial [Paracoccaceae bacterium]|nr:multidrug MFS transporter [Paracoccaceae bacterium]
PETLPPEARSPLKLSRFTTAAKEVVSNRMVMIYAAVLTLGFTQSLALVSSIQPIYADSFDRADTFPLWFALSAVLAMSGTVLNAALVMKLGMRRLAIGAYVYLTLLSGAFLLGMLTGALTGVMAFGAFFVWSFSVFTMGGFTFGNLNALALQPMGHIAGTAASVVGAIFSVTSALLAIPISQAFDGTPVPLVAATLVCSGLALLLMLRTVEHG